MAFIEAPESMDEIGAVPKLVRGPCLLNVVWRGKTPEVSLADAQAMGYKVAILPVLLFTAVIGACDRMLQELRQTGRHPVPLADLTVPEAFQRFGADEWDPLRRS
jgi:2-methylisocitrate lyase-like PEP mutase family enzyme